MIEIEAVGVRLNKVSNLYIGHKVILKEKRGCLYWETVFDSKCFLFSETPSEIFLAKIESLARTDGLPFIGELVPNNFWGTKFSFNKEVFYNAIQKK